MSIPPPPPGSREPNPHLDPGSQEPNLGDTSAPVGFDVVEEENPRTDGNIEAAENAIELKEVEGLSQGRIVWRRFVRHRGAMISLTVIVLITLVAFTSEGLSLWGIRLPGWWPYDYTQLVPLENRGVPSWTHPFGQDDLGRDMFAVVMRGTQQSLMIVFVVGIIATVIGVVIGSLSGFFRGWTDQVLMRVTDIVIIIPLIVLTAVLGRKFGASGAIVLALVLGLASWTGLARLVRGDVLSLREREFVDAARVAGASSARIMFVHILPNSIGVIIVNTTLLMSATILTEAAIGFLGFGVQPPDVSLGSIIYQYQQAFDTRPWLFFWPALFIILIALTINFIGDGLRDAFDPRQKRALNKAARKSAAAAREKAHVAAVAEKDAAARAASKP
ncbi:MAG: ABC transporter permease [Microbacterium sp.]|nr:ABC transporter permease [Microbacterium sp.]